MNPPFAHSTTPHRPAILIARLLALLLGLVQIVNAQTTVTPDIADKVKKPAENSPDASAPTANVNPFTWGQITLHPQIAYRYSSTDGLQTGPGHKVRTDIHTFAPAITAEIGRHWSARYAQTWNKYTSSQFRDTVEQALGVDWSTQYEVWTLSASHLSSSSDSPTIETGSQTKQNSHTSNFTGFYAMGSRYALETSLTQRLQFIEGYNSPRTWTVHEVIHQKTTPQLDSGLGVEYSYSAIKKSADIGAYQLFTTLAWRPIKQLDLSARAGIEKRHIYSNPATESTGPAYSGSIQFIPTTATHIGVTASRATSASLLENQLAKTDSYGLTLEQRVLQRFQFATSYNHAKADYSSTRPGFIVDRKDTTDTASVSLGAVFRSRLSTSVNYVYTNNSSNASGYGFTSNQIGFEISYSF